MASNETNETETRRLLEAQALRAGLDLRGFVPPPGASPTHGRRFDDSRASRSAEGAGGQASASSSSASATRQRSNSRTPPRVRDAIEPDDDAIGGAMSQLSFDEAMPAAPSAQTIRSQLGNAFARARAAARRSSVPRPTLVDAVPPASGPLVTPFRDGHYWCSMCPHRAFTTVPGLMRHFTSAHAGQQVDEPMRALLVAVERATCTNSRCGGLRRVGARACNRCSQPTAARPPQVGDIIAGAASTLVSQPSSHESSQGDARAPLSPNADIIPLSLPDDFSQRVRALPSHTLLHVPKSCRLRALNVADSCWTGMALGSPSHAIAEEGRSKLVLGAIPQGTAAADEVDARLTLWEAGRLEELLQRAEQQQIVMKRGRRRPAQASAEMKSQRAVRLCADGAYRKATSSLVSDMMQMSKDDDLKWAQQLLPVATDHSQAVSQPAEPRPPNPEAAEQAAAFDAEHSPLKGVRYSALTAPGPSGMRPEHMSDMLSVPRRAHANRLLRALAKLHYAIDGGSLVPESRWISNTRQCWQRKKNGKPRPIKMGEFLRSSYAEHVVHANRQLVQDLSGDAPMGHWAPVPLARHD